MRTARTRRASEQSAGALGRVSGKFQPTYTAGVNDRRLFETRTRGSFLVEATDITSVALNKLALLCVYQSQIETFGDVSQVLRYNWTVADSYFNQDKHVLYAERFFRTNACSRFGWP